MRKITTEEFDLTQEGVHRAAEKIDELLTDTMIGSSEILQLKLLSEETLLKYKDRFGEDAEVTILFSEFFGNVKLTLCIKCGSYDPFAGEDAPMSGLMRSMLINTKSVDEVWRYRDGTNYIKFAVARTRKTGQLSRILIGILCGLAGGFFINAVLPGHASMIAEKIIISGARTTIRMHIWNDI